MATYRFRVTFEDYDDITRDIEIRATQTFDDLHHAIHNAIGFDAAKPASFYMSDDNWKKGKEISSRELREDEKEKVALMANAKLSNYIADPHQKIYYVFDFSSHWTFRVELIKIIPGEDPGASYPRCVKTVGEAPKQYNTITIAAIPLVEDFDLDSEEESPEPEGEVLGVEEEDLPEGEDKGDSFLAETDNDAVRLPDEFETAGEDAIDEDASEGDDF